MIALILALMFHIGLPERPVRLDTAHTRLHTEPATRLHF